MSRQHQRHSDGSWWAERVIRPGGRVLFRRRWFRLEDGPLSVAEYAALPHEKKQRGNRPMYDGRMDGLRGLFYTYGNHHEGSRDHVYLHSIVGAEWPGPACVEGYFVWETFGLEPSEVR